VGAIVFPGYEPLFVARKLGAYDGHSIQLVEFPSTPEVVRAFQNQSIEAAALTLDETLALLESQPNLHAVLVLDFSNGADVLMARPKFKTIAELKGKRIGVEVNALGSYLLSHALAPAGLTPADVVVVPTPTYRHKDAFASGELDAIITFEPYKAHLKSMGAITLFDSTQIPGQVVDLLVVRGDLAQARNSQIDALVGGWAAATKLLSTNRTQFAAMAAQREGIKPGEFLQAMEGLVIPNLASNKVLLTTTITPLTKTALEMSRIMVHAGLLRNVVTSLTFLDPGPVSRVSE